MTEPQKITFRREGDPAFATKPENEHSVAADAEQTTVETDPAQGGDSAAPADNTPVEKHIPFDQDPAIQDYIGRQTDKKVKEAVDAIKKEFDGQRQDNADQEKIPSWFGGNQEQWNDYRKDLDSRLSKAQERAIATVTEQSTKKAEAETVAVEEATNYMQSELKSIASDKTLNPTGKPFDQKRAEALFKIVYDEKLVDTQGRWNYRAGMKIMNGTKAPAPVVVNKDRKVLAGATVETSNASGDDKPKTYKTAEDFKKKRPW